MLSQLGSTHQESSQVRKSVFFLFCLSQSQQSVMQHDYFRFDCTLYGISQWMKWKKKMAMKWAQYKYTDNSVCTVNRWRAWKMLEQWLMLITACHRAAMKKNTAEFPSLFPSPVLGGKVFTVTYDLWSNEWREIGRGTCSIRTWWRDAMGREWRSGEALGEMGS